MCSMYVPSIHISDVQELTILQTRSGIVLRAKYAVPPARVCINSQSSHSTLLKSDQWLSQQHQMELNIRGVINLRNVPGSTIYCMGQPTLEAIDNVIKTIKERHPEAKKITWITLREVSYTCDAQS